MDIHTDHPQGYVLSAAPYRVQADGLEIEAAAKRRLADEYDAAQAAGQVKSTPGPIASKQEVIRATDIGLTHKQVHDARQFRDAEARDPGVTKRTLSCSEIRTAQLYGYPYNRCGQGPIIMLAPFKWAKAYV